MLLQDGTNVNHELVKAGWRWWYRKYALGNAELERLEKDAREAKKGLWVDPASIFHRGCIGNRLGDNRSAFVTESGCAVRFGRADQFM